MIDVFIIVAVEKLNFSSSSQEGLKNRERRNTHSALSANTAASAARKLNTWKCDLHVDDVDDGVV